MDIKKFEFNNSVCNQQINDVSIENNLDFLSRKHSNTIKPLFRSTSSIGQVENKSTGVEINSEENEKNENYRQGRWLQSEHFRFLKGCLLYGNNWTEIKKCIKTRSSAQIRSHSQKYLIKLCKKYKCHPNFSSKAKDSEYIFKEDYILEDYEIFPEEKIKELQIFAGILPIPEGIRPEGGGGAPPGPGGAVGH